MRMKVRVHSGAGDVVRSMFIRHDEKWLRIVGRRTDKRAHNLGRCLVLNSDGMWDMFLADEMERDVRTARVDVVPPEGCKSVGVIVSGIPVITDPKEPTFQKPDDGGGHDSCAEWILAVSGDVVRNLEA
jgi:hypothetical protein